MDEWDRHVLFEQISAANDQTRARLAEHGPDDPDLWPIWLELRSLATDIGDLVVEIRQTNALLAALLAGGSPHRRD